MTNKENSDRKIFILDTNVILHNLNSLSAFENNIVLICFTVLEELDKVKGRNTELGKNARDAIRLMDKLREKAVLSGQKMANGVNLPNEGKLRIFVNHTDDINKTISSLGLEDTPDNRIIAVASYLKKTSGKEVILVSKDINARLKADALGIQVQDCNKDKTCQDKSFEELRTFETNSEKIDNFHKKKEMENTSDYFPNEFILLKNEDGSSQSGIGRVTPDGKSIRKALMLPSLGELSLRNKEQKNAAELLLDKEVQVVSLIGKAGTGKTLLALKAGLQSWEEKLYEGIIVSRPIIPMGKDIGYLPGDKDEKLHLWMQPIFDNLKFLLSLKKGGTAKDLVSKHYKGKREAEEKDIFGSAESLISNGIISLEALTYVRGRSIPGQYVIIDEAQNLTPHEVKTIITRAGRDTKIVFTGDPEQIDNPYLDSRSNGLVYLVERTRTSKRFGFVNLKRSERSGLAEEASELL